MTLSVSLKGDLTLRNQLKALGLTPKERLKYHRLLGRKVITNSRQRVKKQQGLSGTGWQQRKSGRGKMLRKLMRSPNPALFAGYKTAKITWKNNRAGQVARRHQDGISETMTAQKAKKRNGTPDYDAPATAAQAKALIKEGFKLYRGKSKSGKSNGKTRQRRVSQRWIRDNMTLGQAGLILREMTNKPSQQSWEIPTPQRDFLGMSKQERSKAGEEILEKVTTNAVKRKR